MFTQEGKKVERSSLWATINVEKNKRALIFRRNRLDSVLEAGQHRISQLNGKVRVEIHQVTDTFQGDGCLLDAGI